MKTSSGKAKKKRRSKASVFDSLRKPLAPPGRPLGRAKPESSAHPVERKAKHKGKIVEADRDV
ncbi:MAG: hypothetical protein H0V88_09650 [Pyrinomonadaceae bacterium]|nr:hypothetical protein [Pyrinomonadaceae bacterium]